MNGKWEMKTTTLGSKTKLTKERRQSVLIAADN